MREDLVISMMVVSKKKMEEEVEVAVTGDEMR